MFKIYENEILVTEVDSIFEARNYIFNRTRIDITDKLADLVFGDLIIGKFRIS